MAILTIARKFRKQKDSEKNKRYTLWPLSKNAVIYFSKTDKKHLKISTRCRTPPKGHSKISKLKNLCNYDGGTEKIQMLKNKQIAGYETRENSTVAVTTDTDKHTACPTAALIVFFRKLRRPF